MEQSSERLAVLNKIKLYEKQGKFDLDVENDPPAPTINVGDVDYTGSKFSSKIQSLFANTAATVHFENRLRKNEFIIKDVIGLENIYSVDSGAIITCNHFNAYDCYAVQKALKKFLHGKPLYKMIREGNYTNFPGLYGYLFRHCNTIPIPSQPHALHEMSRAVNYLLESGNKILIYPEQSMWWNYRKPRPLKPGAFTLAAKAGVPIIPIFITTEDTNKIDSNGFPVQAYTVHVRPPIYPNSKISYRENATRMMNINADEWKTVYEQTYKTPLIYETEK